MPLTLTVSLHEPDSRKRPASQHAEVAGTSSRRLRQSGEVAVAILSVFIADATDRQCVHNCMTQWNCFFCWQQMETVLDHLLFQVRLKHWQVATDTTHKINSIVFSFVS